MPRTTSPGTRTARCRSFSRAPLSAAEKRKQDQKSLFLDETDGWLAAYKPGSLKQKRVDMFKRMKGFAKPWTGPGFRVPGGPPL